MTSYFKVGRKFIGSKASAKYNLTQSIAKEYVYFFHQRIFSFFDSPTFTIIEHNKRLCFLNQFSEFLVVDYTKSGIRKRYIFNEYLANFFQIRNIKRI